MVQFKEKKQQDKIYCSDELKKYRRLNWGFKPLPVPLVHHHHHHR